MRKKNRETRPGSKEDSSLRDLREIFIELREHYDRIFPPVSESTSGFMKSL